eukprot:SAG31_NODE_38142_length_298_cov_1.527638_1_plen_44_part_10
MPAAAAVAAALAIDMDGTLCTSPEHSNGGKDCHLLDVMGVCPAE